MAEAVYLLGSILSALCAVMLLRGYARTGHRLLLWTCLCFLGLTLNNAILFVDMVLVPATNLSIVRLVPALVGLTLLLYGLIWEAE
ncbi:MAG: hypothetical protein KF878_24270 [Planctomycetes bacterium]|nr:hypothetical protein [Planctomycetota bacterium]